MNKQTGSSYNPTLAIGTMIVLIAGITIAAFLPAVDHGFLNWDDDRNFVTNTRFRGLDSVHRAWAWDTYHLGVWQPLSWLLFGLQFEMGGIAPRVYHVTSIALHVLNTTALFLTTILILRTARPESRSLFGPALAAAIFALHPLRVETVAWVSAQPYLPAVFFYLVAVMAYVGLYQKDERPARWILRLSVVFLFYLAAIASKAVAVTLPAILLILDAYPMRRGVSVGAWVRLLAEKIPFFILAALVSMKAAAAKDFNESRIPFEAMELGSGIAQSAYGLVFYLLKTALPVHLVPYCRAPEAFGVFDWPFWAAVIAVVAMTLLAVVKRKQIAGMTAAWFAYVLILLPNLGIVPISKQLVTDRYSYLAIVPFMILVAACINERWMNKTGRTRIAFVGFSAIAVAALFVATRHQVKIWNNSVSLWQANLAIDPDCQVSHCNLGQAFALDGARHEAVNHLNRAVELEPRFSFAHVNLAAMLIATGDFKRAERHFQIALDQTDEFALNDGERARAYAGLAIACAQDGRKRLARQHLSTARRLGLPPDAVLRTMDALD